MEHFVCKGDCKGVSDHAKKCEDANCPNFGKDLELCTCEDGKHEISKPDAEAKTG